MDVGSAEGYTSYIARSKLGCTTVCTDLSDEACKRSHEIFQMESIAADAHNLPFGDSTFDVVLCSETLEHVSCPQKALDELLRIARKAVVLTVPLETPETVEKNRSEKAPHSHINRFHSDSFEHLKELGYTIRKTEMNESSLLSRYGRAILDARTLPDAAVPVISRVLGMRSVAIFILMDYWFCQLTHRNEGLLFVLLKDEKSWSDKEKKRIKPTDIVSTAIPLYHMRIP